MARRNQTQSVSDDMQERILNMVEDHGNRMTLDKAAEELTERVNRHSLFFDEADAEEQIRAAIDENRNLAKDRFGGKDRVEKVVY